MQNMQHVILVDEQDNETGVMDKMEAHRKGLLHRAFSVFLFNSRGEILLQRRAASKYHSPGLWTNACCSHPMPGESLQDAVERRLREELGIYTPTKRVFDFIYHAQLDYGLTEHELDHVFIGEIEEISAINPEEADAVKFVDFETIEAEIKAHPYRFTVWFRLIFPRIKELYLNQNSN